MTFHAVETPLFSLSCLYSYCVICTYFNNCMFFIKGGQGGASVGKVMASIFWDAKALTTFRKAKLSVGNILCQLTAAAKGNQVKTAWKTDEGSPVSPGQCSCTKVCGCNGCYAWLVWTGWSPSIFSWFGTIWLFSVPQHEKNTWLGNRIRPMMLRTFSRIWMRACIPQESKRCNTKWKKCVDHRGNYVVK